MLGQLTTLIYNIADTFFISLTKEPATIAAVTLCASFVMMGLAIHCQTGLRTTFSATWISFSSAREAGAASMVVITAILLERLLQISSS